MMKRVLSISVLCSFMAIMSITSAYTAWLPDGNIIAPFPDPIAESPRSIPDGSGGAIATWQDNRSGNLDIYIQRVDASGVPQWTVAGVAICTASGSQSVPQITPDGSGGAIITWQDYRSGTSWDIYAQRVDASGTPQWTAGGVAVCTVGGNQNTPRITPDGSAGAIITWQDNRNGNLDIYAQRVDASGAPQWTVDGVAVCAAATTQYDTKITSDGSAGAIITWVDHRNGTLDIYAQRVNASGVPQWTADGVAICTASYDQECPQITSDGSAGAIITWHDTRSGDYHIYAQRVNASGVPQWTENGVAICTALFGQGYPQITSDGSGGAIITWQDWRIADSDIFAQRVNASGWPQWTAGGVAVCTAGNYQENLQITSDSSGGAIITWQDNRSGITDIYAQRVDASGVPQWTADGVTVCTAPDTQENPQIMSDGSGGAIITWGDNRDGNNGIYAQRANASGVEQWTNNGVAVCGAGSDQDNPQITSDGSGGAIITWQDNRRGINDIYAQRMDGSGVPQWEAAGVAVCAEGNSQSSSPQLAADGSGGAIITWQDESYGDIYAQRVDASGVPQWGAHGVAICTADGLQYKFQITSDGSGGAIITWEDYRFGVNRIFAQRVDASGAPQWTADGVAICAAGFTQAFPQVTSDGSGGAIITWQGNRSGNYEIYAQRVAANGVPQWAVDGVAICTAANTQANPQIASDGFGGAIITWQDSRGGIATDIYAQRVAANGVPQWAVDGVAICTSGHDQCNPQITSDGSGGAIITWQDSRSGTSWDIYAQRVNASGAAQWQWMVDGIPICAAGNDQDYPQITTDGSGGAFITWQDSRSGTSWDIYAQRMSAIGVARWTAGGVAVCAAGNDQDYPRIASDGFQGAIITWADNRSGIPQIYAGATSVFEPICEVDPLVIDLPGSILVGGSQDTSITITNSGPGALEVNVSASCDQFTILDGEGPWLLTTGQTRVVTVRFQPTLPGTHDCTVETGTYFCGDVTITGTALSPCSIGLTDSIDFGTVEVNCQRNGYFYLENIGSTTLSGTVSVSGGPFTIIGNPSYELAPGVKRSWTVVFEPTAPGTYAGTIDTGNPLCTDIPCAGVAETMVAPVCYTGYTTVNFGNVIIGNAVSYTFRIQNNGGGALTGNVSESCDHYRIVSGGGPFSLACNELVDIEVEFAPTSVGTHTCTIETGGACADFSCTGVGVEPPSVCAVSPTYLDFGRVELGSVEELSFVLKNAGGGTLTGSITKPNTGDCDNFTLVTGGGPYSLGALDSVVVVVRYAPLTAGDTGCLIDTGCSSDVRCYGTGTYPHLLYVDQDATGAMTGASWNDAFVTMQQALAVSIPHGAVVVWVAEGTYKPTSSTSTFDLKRKWSLLGGFAGVETSVEERDPEAHPTILSGELGNPSTFTDNCHTVVSADNTVDSTAVLDGFRVTRANGIAVMITSGSPRITNVTIVDNQASSGGGMLITGSSAQPTLRGVTFDGNRATSATGVGGGLWIGGGSPRLYQVTFLNNTSSRDGGGLCCGATSSPVLDGVLFVDNTASRYGGGMASDAHLGEYANLAFVGNVSSTSTGGGLYMSSPTAVAFTNVSFSRNSAATTGGGIYFAGAGPHLVNAILWGNTAPSESQIRLNGSTPSVISYSLIQGCGGSGAWNSAFGTDGGHNLDADPLFVNALEDSLQLSEGSPAIDAGNSSALGLPTGDLAGNTRISGPSVDMGAYEFIHPAFIEWANLQAPATMTVLAGGVSAPAYGRVWIDGVTSEAGATPDLVAQVGYGPDEGDPVADPGDWQWVAASYHVDADGMDEYVGTFTLASPGQYDYCYRYSYQGGAWVYGDLDGSTNGYSPFQAGQLTYPDPTGIGDMPVPGEFALYPNIPNPFNPTTLIRYDVRDGGGKVALRIYDVNGHLVRTLADAAESAGEKSAVWDGRDEAGRPVASGVYFCRLTAPGFEQVRKMVLLK